MSGHNDVAAAPRSEFRGNVLSAMDRLPAPLRRFMMEAVVDWDPRVARWNLNNRLRTGADPAAAAAAELEHWRGRQATELEIFAHNWPARFGRYTPHHNAGATPLRYDEADRVRQVRGPRQFR